MKSKKNNLRKTRTRITPELFLLIKSVENASLPRSTSHIAKALNLSVSTIYAIKNFNTYEEYRGHVTSRLKTVFNQQSEEASLSQKVERLEVKIKTLEKVVDSLNLATL